VPPVNGRALTAEDVRYAIDRYQNFDKSVHKSLWAFVDKVETPDPQTVVFKLKSPYADAVQIMGGNLGAYISPKEHAESADAATKMVGSGPFVHSEYQTGVSLTFKKNPDYYDKPFPYVDEVKTLIVTDTAKRVADFSAKSVDLTWLFLPDERDQLKRNRPDAKFEEVQGIGGYIYFRADKPPFNDKRVRQGLSMAINRKAIRDAISKGEGVPDQVVFVGLEGWARQVKDLGPAAKYWDYNPQEAKALLKAAGHETMAFEWHHADAAVYTQAYVDVSTLTQAQWKEVGVTVTDRQAPYAQYISTTYQGQYEGIGHSPRAVPYFMDYLTERFYWDDSKGPAGRARINLSYVNNPQLNMLLDKQRGQYNVNDRKGTIKEIETIAAEEQYEVYFSTDTRTYFWDPTITNYRPSGFFPYTHLMKTWKDR
jgi:peptide/nickel transport system substrate-binding protein